MKKIINKFSIVLMIGVAGAGSACQANDFNSNPAQTKANDDGRRPSEKGEGVVGYLRAPEELKYERKDGMIHIRGGEKAVVKSDGSAPTGLAICLQTIGTQQFIDRAHKQDVRFGGLGIETLAETTVNADGSFVLESADRKFSKDRILAINATGQCMEGDDSAVTTPNQIVFMSPDQEGVFSSDPAAIVNAAIKAAQAADEVAGPSEPNSAFFCMSNTDCVDVSYLTVDGDGVPNTVVSSLILEVFPLDASCIREPAFPSDCPPLESHRIDARGVLNLSTLYVSFSIVIYADNYLPWEGRIIDLLDAKLNTIYFPLISAVQNGNSTSTTTSSSISSGL